MECFSKQDYDFLQNIIKTAESIQELYRRLYNLEVQGKKNTDEFQKNLYYLEIALEVEKDKYDSMDKEKLKLLKDYILINYCIDKKDYIKYESASFNVNILENNVIFRILKNINSRLEMKYELIDVSLAQTYKYNFLRETERFKGIGNLTNSISVEVHLWEMLKKDYFNVLLKHINNTLENEKSCFNQFLIRVKYGISFSDCYIETDLLENDFGFKNSRYSNFDLSTSLLHLNSEVCNYLKRYFGIKNYNYLLDFLLSISDIQYDDFEMSCNSLLSEYLIKTSFEFMSEREKQKAKIILNDKKNDIDNNSISKSKALKLFKLINI